MNIETATREELLIFIGRNPWLLAQFNEHRLATGHYTTQEMREVVTRWFSMDGPR